MLVVEESTQGYTLRGADIQLSFRQVGDRWQHGLSVQRNSDWFQLITSEEGIPTDEVLPSPAFQDLRLEELSDGVFEFQLLGQAGRGIYSAAVRFDGGARSIDFDVCARGHSAESPLCTLSRYLLIDGGVSATVHHRGTALVVRAQDQPALEFWPVPSPDHPDSECRLLGVMPVPRIAAGSFCGSGSAPARKGIRVRWRYRITLPRHP